MLTIYILLAIIYLAVTIYLLRKQEGQKKASIFLAIYASLATGLSLADAFQRTGIWQVNPQGAVDIQLYGAYFLAVIMILTTIEFTRRERTIWLITGFAWTIAIIIIHLNILGLEETVWTNGIAILTRDRLAPVLSSIGWFTFTTGALALVRSSYIRSRQPLLRNRLNYWTPVFLLIFINDVLLLAGRQFPDNALRLIATWLAAYIIVTHNPADLKMISRRVLIYIITTLLILAFYVIGFSASQTIFEALPNFNPLLVGAAIALVLSLIFTPLLGMVRSLVNRLYSLEEIQVTKTLHAYSQQISNILDMQKLANVAVGLIIEGMDITRGFLFLVDSNGQNDGKKSHSIRAVRNPGEMQIKPFEIGEENPIVKYFLQDQRPLLQYDLDLLPAFRAVTQSERDWFQLLQAEVYLPIFSKREWIGMLALGTKESGNRYTEDDLVTLSTLANQTAVALENARLVENLIQLNNELRQAYRDLDKANRDLERIDQTKSDFISIASHELRTPLTTMIGYTEMLIEDATLPEDAHELLKGISKGTRRLHQIMDSMFDIAQIDGRTLQLHLTPVDTSLLIKDVGSSYAETLKSRNQTLKVNIPAISHIIADPNLLEKLFQHLISNAIKFTPDKGLIKITARTIPYTENIDLPTGGVEITISDTGVGVDPNAKDLIFSKFYQPGELSKHSTSNTRFKGSGAGLGLALSKGIVEAHGGRIWVESAGYDEERFPGSVFHITLPVDTNEEIIGTEVNVEIP